MPRPPRAEEILGKLDGTGQRREPQTSYGRRPESQRDPHHRLTRTNRGLSAVIGRGSEVGILAVLRGPTLVGIALLGRSISTNAPSFATPVSAAGPPGPGFVGPNG